MTNDDERLETPKQLARRVGITERQVRHLVQVRQLEHVPIGRRIFIPVGAFARFLEAKKVAPCQDETKAPDFAGSPSAAATISSGPREGAVASAALARQTAKRLKSCSDNSSNSGTSERGRVIPLKSS